MHYAGLVLNDVVSV